MKNDYTTLLQYGNICYSYSRLKVKEGEFMRQWERLDESRDEFHRKFSEIREPIAKTRPKDIHKLIGKWGEDQEVRNSVMLLIEFFQEMDCWCSFTLSELIEFSKKKGRDPDLVFYGINGGFYSPYPLIIGSFQTQPEPWLIADSDGQYRITTAFIKRCLGQ